MDYKTCNNCKLEKPLSSFVKRKDSNNGYRCTCKTCQKEYDRKRYLQNIDVILERNKEYRKNNTDVIKTIEKEYYENNKDIIKKRKQTWYENNKEDVKKKRDIWRQNNKEKIRKFKKEYRKNKRKSDEIYKITENIRSLIRGSFKRLNFSKNSKTAKIVGCSFEDLKNYLFENVKIRYPDFKDEDFLEKGKYHIDHIIPLSLSKTEEDVIKLCHYSNLQLLKAEDNLRKSNKIGDF